MIEQKEKVFGIYEEDLVSLVFDKINQEEFKFCRKDLKLIFQTFIDEIVDCLDYGTKVQIKDFISVKPYLPKISQSKHPITGEIVTKGRNKRIKVMPIGRLKEILKKEKGDN